MGSGWRAGCKNRNAFGLRSFAEIRICAAPNLQPEKDPEVRPVVLGTGEGLGGLRCATVDKHARQRVIADFSDSGVRGRGGERQETDSP